MYTKKKTLGFVNFSFHVDGAWHGVFILQYLRFIKLNYKCTIILYTEANCAIKFFF